MKNIIKKYLSYNLKYSISINARSISFYFISSIASITVIIISSINELNNVLDSSIYLDILKIVSNLYSILVSSYTNNIRFTGFSLILVLSIIYCFSKIIYSYKIFGKKLFLETKQQLLLRDVVNSFLLVIDLLLIILSNILIYLYSDILIKFVFNNRIILILLHYIIELVLLFILIIIFYKIIIPKKILLKNIKKESFGVSIIIYLILSIFVLLFNVLYVESNIVGITFVLSMFSFFIFLVNYVILFGFIVIYENDNKVNNITGGNNNEN